jgi:hypothetical protein
VRVCMPGVSTPITFWKWGSRRYNPIAHCTRALCACCARGAWLAVDITGSIAISYNLCPAQARPSAPDYRSAARGSANRDCVGEEGFRPLHATIEWK